VTEAPAWQTLAQATTGWALRSAITTMTAIPTSSVTSYGRNILYQTTATEPSQTSLQAGSRGGGWPCRPGFIDFDNDGHLDLFVTRYME